MAWIAGVLFFTQELIFVGYMMTVFMAGQGLIIFIILIPLSKQVRPIGNKIIVVMYSRRLY